MQWYVSRNGESSGPIEEADIAAWIRSGQIGSETYVRDEHSQHWIPIGQSPFAPLFSQVASAPASQPKPSSNRGVVLWGSVTTVLLIGLIGAKVATESTSADATEAVVTLEPRAPSVGDEPEPTLTDRLARAGTLGEAIATIRPAMADHDGDSLSGAAATLTTWLVERYNTPALWADLDMMPDNQRAEVLKDPEPFRGKKLCSRGTMTQIMADRSLGVPVWHGVLSTGFANVIRFVAVGSSDGIVEDSPARFCGIVIGLHSYANRMGGSTTGVEVVGSFDLPENRSFN